MILDASILALTLFASKRAGIFKQLNRFAIFHLWMLYTGFANVNAGGILRARWGVAVAMAVLGTLWFLSARRRPHLGLISGVAIFLGICTLSASYSLVPNYTFLRSGGLVLLFAATVLGSQSLVGSARYAELTFRSFSIAALVPAAYIFAGFRDGTPAISEDARWTIESLRATGTATLALVGVIVLAYPIRHTRGPVRILAVLAALALLAVCVATRTRGVLLTAACVLPLLGLALLGVKRLPAVAGAYLAIFGVAFAIVQVTDSQSKLQRLFRVEDTETMLHTRVEDRWDILWEKALERPALGRGFGASRFYEIPDDDLEEASTGVSDAVSVPHNQFLGILYDTGVLGLLAFIALQAYVGHHAFYGLRKPASRDRSRHLVYSALWMHGTIAMLFHDGRLTIGSPMAYWYWLVCTAVVVGHGAGVGLTSRQPGPHPLILEPELDLEGRAPRE